MNVAVQKNMPIGIGIGASAGGLEALEIVFENLPESLQKKVYFVVAQHLSPKHSSLLVPILSKVSKFPVVQAENNKIVEAGKIYITPPDSDIQIKKGTIKLSKPKNKLGPKPSVDKLFESIAQEYKEKAIGIILSGTGSDGSLGVIKIKENGGNSIVQYPESAKYDGMPHSAIQTGCVNYESYAEHIGAKIVELLNFKKRKVQTHSRQEETRRIFKEIQLEFGTDFNQYKMTTILRRIEKRMLFLSIPNYSDYTQLIINNKEEKNILYQSFLIGVSGFFRDAELFKNLELEIEKKIKADEIKENFRIWIPGCSNGEEAYSICMMVDYLFTTKYKIRSNIQIFATDISNKSLLVARKGIYEIGLRNKISKELIQSYTIDQNSEFLIDKSIRSKVLFSQHDLTNNPPFLNIDLISCRNLLIYLNQDVQKRIFSIFHYSLNEKGILFLGKSESISGSEELFEVLNSKSKIFQKKHVHSKRLIKLGHFKPLKNSLNKDEQILSKKDYLMNQKELIREKIIHLIEPIYLIVSENLEILETHGKISEILEIAEGNIHMNLSSLLRKSLLTEVKKLILQCNKLGENKSSIVNNVFVDGIQISYKISVGHLSEYNNPGYNKAVLLVFEKIESIKQKPFKPEDFNSQRLIEVEQELEITKIHLQSYIDEIETTNQELQSLNEELQSSNEELQSSNEELETSNEELQASNEELQTAYSEIKHINQELEIKEKELIESNNLFYSMFENSPQGNILLDPNLSLILFNEPAKKIISQIGLGKLEKSKNILDIIGNHADFDRILAAIRKVQLEKKSFFENLRTKTNLEIFHTELHITPILLNGNIQYISLNLIDLSNLVKKEEEIFERDEMLNSLLESNTTFLIRLDLLGNYTYVNNAFCQKFGVSPSEIIGKNYLTTIHPDDLSECEKTGYQILTQPNLIHKSQIRKPKANGVYIDTDWEYVAIQNNEGIIKEIQGVGRDITDQKKMLLDLEEERNHLEMLIWGGRLGTWDWNLVSNEIVFNERWAEMLGYEGAQIKLAYSDWEKTILKSDLPKVKEALELTIKGERSFYELEYRCIGLNGKIIWMYSTGKVIEKNKKKKPLRILGIHQDITEKKDTESKIRTIEDRNNAIVSTLNEGIVIQNLDGEIISCNSSAEKLLGISFDQMIGKSSIDPIWKTIKEDGSEFPGEEHPAMKTLKTGVAQSDVVMGIIKPNGELTWINVYAHLLYHTDSKIPYAVFTIFHDFTDRKKAEEELEKNKNLLNDTGRVAQIGGWEFDLKSKQITWTEETFRIHEYYENSAPDLETIRAFFDETNLPILDNAFKMAIEKDIPFDLELKLKTLLGNEKWVRIIGKGKYDAEGITKIIGSVQNITKIKKQELELHSEKTRLNGIIEGTNVGTWEWDVRTNITIFNDRWASMLGYTLEELAPISFQTWVDLAHPIDLKNANAQIQKHLQKEIDYYEVEMRMRHKNGDWKWILTRGKIVKTDENNEPIQLSGIHIDITQSKLLEEELKKLSIVAERTSNAVVVSDNLGRITWVNESFTKITGYKLDEVKGKKPKSIFHYQGTNPETIKYLHNKLKKLEDAKCEIKNRGKFGQEYWIDLEIKALFDQSGVHTGFMAVQADITESRKAEQVLKHKNEQLENINKELEQFVYIASHDLQEPLLTIRNCAEIIKSEMAVNLDEEMNMYLDFIFQSSERLRELIKGLMQYSRIGRERRIEEINLNNLLLDIKKDLQFSIEESSSIIKYDELPTVNAYPTELRLLFQNLISNSIKFRTLNSQTIIEITCTESDENWSFMVEDNGIGVDPKNLEKVFIIFKRLHNRDEYEGTGIGLAHCKKIIELHGGKIWMESEKGKGCKVIFTIPKNQ
ncbi:MAG: PAS domain S-box protein [Bacteroidia bacterium]